MHTDTELHFGTHLSGHCIWNHFHYCTATVAQLWPINIPVFSPEFTGQRTQIISRDHTPHLECSDCQYQTFVACVPLSTKYLVQFNIQSPICWFWGGAKGHIIGFGAGPKGHIRAPKGLWKRPSKNLELYPKRAHTRLQLAVINQSTTLRKVPAYEQDHHVLWRSLLVFGKGHLPCRRSLLILKQGFWFLAKWCYCWFQLSWTLKLRSLVPTKFYLAAEIKSTCSCEMKSGSEAKTSPYYAGIILNVMVAFKHQA